MPFLIMLDETNVIKVLGNESDTHLVANHWSDEFGSGVRASIFFIELLEWIFLLIGVIGMYLGIEIGHPSNATSATSHFMDAS